MTVTALFGCARQAQSALPPAPIPDSAVLGQAVPDTIKTCDRPTACIGGTNWSSGPGVEGVNKGYGNGVYALANNNDGIDGTTVNPSNTQLNRSGVYGADNSTDGGGGNAGVSGSSTYWYGVQGNSTSHWGVLGQSTYSFGVVAQSDGLPLLTFPASTTELQTIQSLGGTSNDSNGYNLATFQNNGTPAFWVDNASNAHVNGLIYTLGSCSAGCSRTRGARVASYVAQSSTPILEDRGEARLSGGQTRIAIDPSLARAIAQGATYVVFVSPEGPSHGLYVTAKTSAGFRVVENDGGRSAIAFSYRIEAKPLAIHAARLPVVAAAQMPHAVPVRAPKELPR
jgi:hypothetical protein